MRKLILFGIMFLALITSSYADLNKDLQHVWITTNDSTAVDLLIDQVGTLNLSLSVSNRCDGLSISGEGRVACNSEDGNAYSYIDSSLIKNLSLEGNSFTFSMKFQQTKAQDNGYWGLMRWGKAGVNNLLRWYINYGGITNNTNVLSQINNERTNYLHNLPINYNQTTHLGVVSCSDEKNEALYYVDGKIVSNTTLIYGTCYNLTNKYPLVVGATGLASEPAYIIYSDVYVWNRSLEVSEVLDLNDTATGLYPFPASNSAPTIAINNPANSSMNYGTNILFNYTPTDADGNSMNCTINFNSSAINVTKSIVSGTETTYSFTAPHDMINQIWNVSCTDGTATTLSSNYNVSIDIAPPTISQLTNITDNSSATINWTTNELANDTINYGTTISLGTTYTNSTFITAHSFNLTGLTNGTTYYYNITSCDEYGYCQVNGTFDFTTQNDGDITSPEVLFDSQTPSDVDTLNLFSSTMNVSYNISDSELNTSTIKLYYYLNSTERTSFFFVNGTNTTSSFILTGRNVSDKWSFIFNDNDVYPSTYNYDEEIMEDTQPNITKLTGANQYLKIRLFNVYENFRYGIFEVMAQRESGTGLMEIFYCNSSYSSGNPTSSNFCTPFYTLDASKEFNHSHTTYSKHHIVPFGVNLSTKSINDVGITSTSYFLLRGATGTTFNVSYITNISRADTIQNSSNNGVSFSNFAGTINSHLHQYNETAQINYYVCANDTSNNQNCSTTKIDLLDLGGLPPLSPVVYHPNSTTYAGTININYTSAVSLNSYPITNYNITLVNVSNDYEYSLIVNNSPNLGYSFDSSLYDDSNYSIYVTACDNQTLCSIGMSEVFTTDNTAPSWNETLTTRYVEYGNSLYYDVNATDLNFDAYSINDTTKFSIDASGNIANVSLLNVGIYSLNITANDTLGNHNSSVIQVNVSDTTPPVLFDFHPNINFTATQVINISANATDSLIANVTANLTYPNGSMQNFELIRSGDTFYYDLYISAEGTYNMIFRANDTSNNINQSGLYEFNLILPTSEASSITQFTSFTPKNYSISNLDKLNLDLQKIINVYGNKYTLAQVSSIQSTLTNDQIINLLKMKLKVKQTKSQTQLITSPILSANNLTYIVANQYGIGIDKFNLASGKQTTKKILSYGLQNTTLDLSCEGLCKNVVIPKTISIGNYKETELKFTMPKLNESQTITFKINTQDKNGNKGSLIYEVKNLDEGIIETLKRNFNEPFTEIKYSDKDAPIPVPKPFVSTIGATVVGAVTVIAIGSNPMGWITGGVLFLASNPTILYFL